MRYTNDDGSIGHAELALGDAVIALATPPGIGYESPKHHREHCTTAMRWTEQPWLVNGIMVYVETSTRMPAAPATPAPWCSASRPTSPTAYAATGSKTWKATAGCSASTPPTSAPEEWGATTGG